MQPTTTMPQMLGNKTGRVQGMEALSVGAALMVVLYHLVMLASISLPDCPHAIKRTFGLGLTFAALRTDCKADRKIARPQNTERDILQELRVPHLRPESAISRCFFQASPIGRH